MSVSLTAPLDVQRVRRVLEEQKLYKLLLKCAHNAGQVNNNRVCEKLIKEKRSVHQTNVCF